jgi:hypothetical protein
MVTTALADPPWDCKVGMGIELDLVYAKTGDRELSL